MVVDISAATIIISLVVLLLENFQVSCEIVRVSEPQAGLSSSIYLAEYSLSHSESLLNNYYLDLKIHLNSKEAHSLLCHRINWVVHFKNMIFRILSWFCKYWNISNIEIFQYFKNFKYWNIEIFQILKYFNISICQIFK